MKRFLIAAAIAFPLVAQPVTETAPQTTPPAPSAPREAKLPQPVEKKLENGLRVIVVPKHDVPLVAARLLVRAGRAADPAGRAGVADLTATVLTQGTKTKSAEQIARGVEALGATLSADSQWDSSTIDISVMSSNLPQALEYVADVAMNPTFAKSEFEREQAQAIDALQVSLSQPASLASAVATRLVFGDRPYGRTSTPQTVANVTRTDLVEFHRTHYIPQQSVLVMSGDITADAAFALAQRVFGAWKRGSTAVAAAAHAKEPLPRRVVVIDMPEAGNSAVVVARPGIRRVDPAYTQAIVANSVLGGGYSSRLNQEIRIRRGLSYGARSGFDPRVERGPFTARTDTKHETADEAAVLLTSEMTRLGSSDIPETELVPRKAALIGEFAQTLETTSGIVDEISTLALHDISLSEINRYISSVQGVQSAEVRKFASANLGGDATVVIVGDAKQFVAPLREQFGEVEVITYEELDLNSPTLRVRKKKD